MSGGYVPRPCICGEEVGGRGPFQGHVDPDGSFRTIHTRCADWSEKRCPVTYWIDVMAKVWPRLLPATQAAALPACHRLREMQRAWPPEPFSGEAAAAVIDELIYLRMRLTAALRDDPKAKGTLRTLI